jgi:hypothetical protein
MSRAPRLWGTPYTKANFGRVSNSFGIFIKILPKKRSKYAKI